MGVGIPGYFFFTSAYYYSCLLDSFGIDKINFSGFSCIFMKRKEMRILLLCLVLVIGTYAFNYAQIINSSFRGDRGVVWEVLSEEQRDSLTNVIDGRTILNSTTNCINYYSNKNWYALCGDCLPETPPVKIDSVVFTNGNLSVYFDEKKARNEKINSFVIKLLPFNWNFSTDHSPFTVDLKVDSILSTIVIAGIGKCGLGDDRLMDSVLVYSYHPCGNQKFVTDSRDGHLYELVEINNQCWIKGYLKYIPSSKTNYVKDKELIFYEWSKEFSLDQNGMCPAGFHIPNKVEADFFSDLVDDPYNQFVTQEAYDKKLKEFGVDYIGGYDGKKAKFFTGESDFFWVREFKDIQEAYLVLLTHKAAMITTVTKKSFMPIRCIKN
jgi:uncharacterized protein (TIGR02145 family)